jgi:hypothetical protein
MGTNLTELKPLSLISVYALEGQDSSEKSSQNYGTENCHPK